MPYFAGFRPSAFAQDRAMHVVAVVVPHGVIPLDLAIPCGMFGVSPVPGAQAHYKLQVCGEAKTVRSGGFKVVAPHGLDRVARADTVIVPGIEDIDAPVSPKIIAALRAAAKRGARIASICSGAFVLAAAGLLDGRRATTHWLAAASLAARYPRVQVDPNVLFVDEGQILTSAGAAAGMDLCLHMLRNDLGAAAAADAARLAVVPLERRGGQAQFIKHPAPTSSASLGPLLKWLDENLQRPLTIADMARRASTSLRTFSRRFHEQTGTTPLQWLTTARVRRAQSLLETTQLGVERVATLTGFKSAPTFRDCFRRTVGLSPSDYRKSFRSTLRVSHARKAAPQRIRSSVSAHTLDREPTQQ
jgi:transcriptional regulator GlxA family with amidase domain